MDTETVRDLLLKLVAEYEALQVENQYFRQQYGEQLDLLRARGDENSSAVPTVFAASTNSLPQLATSSSIINIQPTKQMELLHIDELPEEDWALESDSKAFGSDRRDSVGFEQRPTAGSESPPILSPCIGSVSTGRRSVSTGTSQRTLKGLRIGDKYKQYDRKPFLRIVEHPWFERFIALIIMMDVSLMGYAADYAIHNLQKPEPRSFTFLELSFCICYSIELVMKMIAHGRAFFRPPYRSWNLFDSLLLAHALYEQFVTFVKPGASSTGNISLLRSMRLMKTLKMLRVVRLMRSMFELRILLASIMGSLKSMFWSLVLLVVVLYMFGLMIVQAFAKHLSLHDKYGQAAGERHTIDQINRYWGSVGSAMLSLFACSTGGSDWREVAEPINILGPGVYALFCFYIAFFIFVILNTITALFVETTIQASMRDYQVGIRTQLDKKDEYKGMLQCLFDEMDDTGDGLVSLEEFSSHMEDPRMCAFLSCMGLEVFDAIQFFRLLSDGGTHPVDCEQFVSNCIRMRGQAMSMDVHELLVRMRTFNRVADERHKASHAIAMELAGHFNIDVPDLNTMNGAA